MYSNLFQKVKYYFENEKFITSLFLTFIIILVASLIQIIGSATSQSFTYMNGKEPLLSAGMLAKKYIHGEYDPNAFLDALRSASKDKSLPLEEQYFVSFLYYHFVMKGVFWEEKVKFLSECSVKQNVTPDLRSFCIYQIFSRMMMADNVYNKSIDYLANVPPYQTILQNRETKDAVFMNLIQFCSDTSKKGVCPFYYAFLRSENYGSENGHDKVVSQEFFRTFDSGKDGNWRYLDYNWQIFGSLMAICKMLELNTEINLAELTLNPDQKSIQSLHDWLDQYAESNPGDNNVRAWLEFTQAKYFIYKNDLKEAKVHIENLEKIDSKDQEVWTLFKQTNLLDSDKVRFRQVVPDFMEN